MMAVKDVNEIIAAAQAAQKRATARSAEIANRNKPSNFTYGAGNPLSDVYVEPTRPDTNPC
jgi:hypothetical protein